MACSNKISTAWVLWSFAAAGCVMQPSGGKPTPGSGEGRPHQKAPETPETPEPQDDADWWPVTATLKAPDLPAVVGYDAIVSSVWHKPEYGSCMRCHALDWPRLDDFGALTASATERGYPDAAALGVFIADCVDPATEAACAGAPDDSADNVDYKMPSKFGFSMVTADDLSLLKRWLSDGAQERSQASGPSVWQGVERVELAAAGERDDDVAAFYDVKKLKLTGTAAGTMLTVRLFMRREGGCVAASARFNFLNADDQLVVAADGGVTCKEGQPQLTALGDVNSSR